MTRSMIMEGNAGCFIPEVASVRQGTKIFYAYGRDKSVCESADYTLVESLEVLEMEERGGHHVVKNGVWTVEGVFQRADVKNANGRVYPRKIWERLISDKKGRIVELIENRAALGHLEHPADGRSDANKGCLLTVGLKLLEDGRVWGTAEILNTPAGLILQEYTARNVRWGVSSRGEGEVKEDGTVSEDYECHAFDAVSSPSTPGAFPKLLASKPVKESTTTESTTTESTATVETVVPWGAELTALMGLQESEWVGALQDRIRLMNRMLNAIPETLPTQTQKENDKAWVWCRKRLKSLSESVILDCQAAATCATMATKEKELQEALRVAESVIAGKDAELQDRTTRLAEHHIQLHEKINRVQSLKRKLVEHRKSHENKVRQLRESLRISVDEVRQHKERLSEALDETKRSSRTPVQFVTTPPLQSVPRNMRVESADDAGARHTYTHDPKLRAVVNATRSLARMKG